MIIRNEQLQAFQAESVRQFVSKLVDESAEKFPKHWGALGRAGMQPIVEHGVKRAGIYGFDFEYSLSTYVDIMLLLGSHFDIDFQLPWAAGILTDSSITDQGIRAIQLHDAAMGYLARVSGEDRRQIQAALDRVRAGWNRLFVSGGASLTDQILRSLFHIHPEKCDVIGGPVLDRLVTEGTAAAAKHGVRTREGVMLFVGLMFILGSHFDEDPQFPWVENCLTALRRNDDQGFHAAALQVRKQIDYWLA
jgi:hypothetical protein